jgi:hypothetical protein
MGHQKNLRSLGKIFHFHLLAGGDGHLCSFFASAMSFSAYSTPHPQTRFSNESFREITVAEADDIVRNNQLPHILPKNTATSWDFTREVPIAVSEIIVAAGEFIPCLDDLLPITQAMEFAFSQQGARSVCIQLPHGAVRYHLSKVC